MSKKYELEAVTVDKKLHWQIRAPGGYIVNEYLWGDYEKDLAVTHCDRLNHFFGNKSAAAKEERKACIANLKDMLS